MRVRLQDQILFLHPEDAPTFKKGGSVVRNSYFWALKSIAGRAQRGKEWQFEEDVWFALQRMLLSFMESGYLGLRETQLEFPGDERIPALLRSVATWQAEDADRQECDRVLESSSGLSR
jgi:hypothetical protein